MEHRAAPAPGEPPRTFGPIGFWSRVPGRIASPTVIAYLADMVPMMIVHAAGRAGAGTSLDNTMRFGEPPDDEWVLLHVLPEQRSDERRVGQEGVSTLCIWWSPYHEKKKKQLNLQTVG